MSEFWKFTANATVILVGWVVVHKLSIRRDWDKARRDMVSKFTDDANKELDELLNTALAYHCGIRDMASERSIKMKLQDLSQRLAGLSKISTDSGNLNHCQSSIRKLREAVTGKHFEDEHTASIPEDDEQLATIALETLNAKREIMTLRHALYAEVNH